MVKTEDRARKSVAVDQLKKAADNWAAAQLKDGMVVGLGSRSTASFAVDEIRRLVKAGLRIVGIPTSENTAQQARRLAIPLSTLGEYPETDVTIDGADEVELRTLNLIKGGGAIFYAKDCRNREQAADHCGRPKQTSGPT